MGEIKDLTAGKWGEHVTEKVQVLSFRKEMNELMNEREWQTECALVLLTSSMASSVGPFWNVLSFP